MKKCKNCNVKSISNFQLFLVGFGSKIRCSHCKAQLRMNTIGQMILSAFLTILTLVLLVILTNELGVIGFVLAFVIPVIIDVVASFLLPLKVVSTELKGSK